MPTVVRDGEFAFIIHTRELPFEPPHVHVRFGADELRIELGGGIFMDQPPLGKGRAILRAFERHAATIRRSWEEIHGLPEDQR